MRRSIAVWVERRWWCEEWVRTRNLDRDRRVVAAQLGPESVNDRSVIAVHQWNDAAAAAAAMATPARMKWHCLCIYRTTTVRHRCPIRRSTQAVCAVARELDSVRIYKNPSRPRNVWVRMPTTTSITIVVSFSRLTCDVPFTNLWIGFSDF